MSPSPSPLQSPGPVISQSPGGGVLQSPMSPHSMQQSPRLGTPHSQVNTFQKLKWKEIYNTLRICIKKS